MKKHKLLICILLSTFFSIVNAQNEKKIFKYIEEGKIEDATHELKKTDYSKGYKRKKLLLIQLGNIIILGNKDYQFYEPVSAFNLFKSLKISNLESVEIDDFLANYNLNLNIISDLLFTNILDKAKKINTESSYDDALNICKPCKYEVEIKNLKAQAAYNACISKGTVDGYKYFIEKYTNTVYTSDITELLYKKAFEEAKTDMTVVSMNNYINNYSNSIYVKSAIGIRDSIALPKNKSDYNSLLIYTKEYPNSKYTSKIIKVDLPNILYNEALTTNTVESLNKFIIEYPGDFRVQEIKNKLEIAYFNLLRKNFSYKEFNSFKSQFPNSIYIKELNSIRENLMTNSDLSKENLKGPVKIIETSIYDISYKKIVFNSKREFNEIGKMKSFISDSYFHDKIEDFIMEYKPEEFEDEFLIVLPFGRKISTLGVGNNMGYAFGGSLSLFYEYDSEGKLISVDDIKFSYDGNNKLIETNYSNQPNRSNYSPTIDGRDINRVKFKWQDGKLISKYAYNDKGDRFDKLYDVEYFNDQQIIKAYEDNKDEPNFIITITKNADGQIVNKKRVNYGNYGWAIGPNVWPKYSNDYFYSKGFIVKVNNNIVVTRDSQGNVLYIDKDPYSRGQFSHDTEWAYEYDSYGNWIKRTEFSVKLGDIKITKKVYEVTRKISYY